MAFHQWGQVASQAWSQLPLAVLESSEAGAQREALWRVRLASCYCGEIRGNTPERVMCQMGFSNPSGTSPLWCVTLYGLHWSHHPFNAPGIDSMNMELSKHSRSQPPTIEQRLKTETMSASKVKLGFYKSFNTSWVLIKCYFNKWVPVLKYFRSTGLWHLTVENYLLLSIRNPHAAFYQRKRVSAK